MSNVRLATVTKIAEVKQDRDGLKICWATGRVGFELPLPKGEAWRLMKLLEMAHDYEGRPPVPQ